MALIANVNRDKDAKAFSPIDFHPYETRPKLKRRGITKAALNAMIEAFSK